MEHRNDEANAGARIQRPILREDETNPMLTPSRPSGASTNLGPVPGRPTHGIAMQWYPMPSTERGSHREEMQGKGMLLSQKEKKKAIQEIADMVLERTSKMCNFLEWKDYTLVYKRFAGLYFILGIDREDNELLALEFIQHWVETLDKYFGSVCELDLIFHFHKAYFILDELVVGGHYGEPSKSMVCNSMEHQDELSDSQSMPGVFAGS